MQIINYAGWERCVRLSNGIVELVATMDVGPRIIRFGFIGGDNEFKEYPEMLGKTGGDEWRIYGGHRLWHAPEAMPRTYCPDNQPVHVEEILGGIQLIAPVEPSTQIQKEIYLRLASNEASVIVVHRLRNLNPWAVEFAPWALSVMAQGGTAIVPLPPRGDHAHNLLPVSTLTLWAYTDMSDTRWHWGSRYVLLKQNSQDHNPQKIGAWVPDGWVAYVRNNHLFVKRFDLVAKKLYPDFGACVEVFTDGNMLEVETLGPLTLVEPGNIVEHVEHWHLFDSVPQPHNDADVDAHILQLVRKLKNSNEVKNV
jgi:hypothetical protein